MKIKYESAGEIETRLFGSIVRFDGVPVEIIRTYSATDGTQWLDWRRISGPNREDNHGSAQVDDPRWDFSAPRLGYLNGPNHALYVERVPGRVYSQGLRRQNIRMLLDAGNVGTSGEGVTTRLEHYFGRVSYLEDMLLQKYPSLERCIADVTERNRVSAAFCRNFSVMLDDFRNDLVLNYRGRSVGWSHGKSGFVLSEPYKYLKESVEEQGIKVA